MSGVQANQDFSFSEGFSVFGRLTTYFGAIIGTIFMIVCIYFGFKFVTEKDVYTGKTVAEIIYGSQCDLIQGDQSTKSYYSCNLRISYNIGNKNFDNVPLILENSSVRYSVGNKINIKYNPDKDMDIMVDDKINKRLVGWLMIIFGILFLIGIWVWTYFVHVNKSFSSIVGGTNVASMLLRR